jgi:aquaporin Z
MPGLPAAPRLGGDGAERGVRSHAAGRRLVYGVILLGEVITTFALIAGLCVFLGFRKLRPFTPAIFPFLFAFMVWAASPISGTSTNPARSLGPAILSGEWQGWWIYWVRPLFGTLVAVIVFIFLAKRIAVAKLYYFDSDRHRMFHKAA